MDGQNIRDGELKRIMTELLSPEVLVMEEAFQSLCLYFHDGDIDAVYRTLLERGDSQSVYWLVRYLVGVERPRGFQMLVELAKGDNEFIRDEARGGIAKVEAGARVELLFSLLDSEWEKQVVFAVGQLGQLRVAKAVIPLTELMEKHPDSDMIAIGAVHALGRIGTREAFIALERIAARARDKVLDEVLLVLGRLSRSFNLHHIEQYASSENQAVREVAYQAAAKGFAAQGERYIVQGLERETDEALKLKILLWIRTVRSRRLFRTVFRLAAGDRSNKVRMMAHTVITRAQSPRMMRFLVRQERESAAEEKALALRFLAGYGGVPAVREIFIANYNRRSDNAMRLIAIECLGQHKDKKAIPFLLKIIKERNPYSYAAAISLCYLIDAAEWNTVSNLLAMDEMLEPQVIQIFLRFILRLPAAYDLPDDIRRHIVRLTAAGSPYVRYLAVRCYPKAGVADIVARLMNGVRRDPSSMVRKAYIKSLTQVLDRQEEAVAKLLAETTHRRSVPPPYGRLIRRVAMSQEGFCDVLRQILIILSLEFAGENMKRTSYAGRLMVLLKAMAERHKAFFLKYLKDNAKDNNERWTMMRVVNDTDIHLFGGISVDFMAGQYRRAGAVLKMEYLTFFRRMCAVSEAIEQAVFDDLSGEVDEDVRKGIGTVIAGWIETKRDRCILL